MGIAPAIDLTADQRRTILELLNRHLPNTTVWAYGSRVKWNSHPASDLDLVAFAKPEQSPRIAELREAFDESMLPFRVDLFVWDDMSDDFRGRIEAAYVVLARKERPAYREWPTVTLGDCIEMNDATIAPKENWAFVNYLDTGNITDNRVGEIQHLVAGQDKIPSRARRKAQLGDILYSTVRPNQRHFGLLKKVPENFLASTGFAVIRGKKDCAHTDFLYWFLTQDSVVAHLHTIAEHSTSAYPSIRPTDIERLTLELPPLPEQRAIAQILGALDDKVELNRRIAEMLEEIVGTLFKSWFEGFENPHLNQNSQPRSRNPTECGWLSAESWSGASQPMTALSNLFDFNPPRPLTQGHVAPYLDMANMPTKTHTPRSVIRRPYRSGTRFRNGDTLIARITPCLEHGKMAYVDFLEEGEVGWGSTEFIVMRPKYPIPTSFAYFLARERRFRQFAIKNMVGSSGRQRVSAKAVSGFPVTVPDQAHCVLFGNYATPLMARSSMLNRESRALAGLRDTLLPKLIGGKILIQDAEDLVEAAP